MANSIKHRQRSSRKYQASSIPVNMFYNNAIKVAEAHQMKDQAKINLETQETVVE